MTRFDHVKTGLFFALFLVFVGAWLWGVIAYAWEGHIAGMIAAFFLPPVGVLHALGLF
jgi:uncharacterized membrane protein YqaE (UPF0057 family)